MKQTIDSFFKQGRSGVTVPSLVVDSMCQTELASENDEAEKDLQGIYMREKRYGHLTPIRYVFRHQWPHMPLDFMDYIYFIFP